MPTWVRGPVLGDRRVDGVDAALRDVVLQPVRAEGREDEGADGGAGGTASGRRAQRPARAGRGLRAGGGALGVRSMVAVRCGSPLGRCVWAVVVTVTCVVSRSGGGVPTLRDTAVPCPAGRRRASTRVPPRCGRPGRRDPPQDGAGPGGDQRRIAARGDRLGRRGPWASRSPQGPASARSARRRPPRRGRPPAASPGRPTRCCARSCPTGTAASRSPRSSARGRRGRAPRARGRSAAGTAGPTRRPCGRGEEGEHPVGDARSRRPPRRGRRRCRARPMSSRRRLLEQVAARAGAQRGEDRVVVLAHRQDEDRHLGARGREPGRRRDAALTGHPQVHDDHVGGERSTASTACSPVATWATTSTSGRSPSTVTRPSRKTGWSSATTTRSGPHRERLGSRARSSVPPRAPGPTSKRPPTSAARSRMHVSPTPGGAAGSARDRRPRPPPQPALLEPDPHGAVRAPLCRTALATASAVIRYAATSTAAGSSPAAARATPSRDRAVRREVLAQRPGQPELVQRRRPQVVDGAAYRGDGPAHLVARAARRAPRAPGRARAARPGCRAAAPCRRARGRRRRAGRAAAAGAPPRARRRAARG